MNSQINTISHEPTKTAWAFAVDQRYTGRRAKLHKSLRHLRNSRRIAVRLGLFDGSEPVISDRKVAIATLKEERTGTARQKESGVMGALRESCINHSVITACSKEAKKFGVQAGMRYKDARTLIPNLKVLVYGRH